ncbi:MAG: hypothetical protein AABX02_04620, partial [archaeon]
YDITLTRLVGKPVVHVQVLDEEGAPISILPAISFRTIGGWVCPGNECMVQADEKGSASYTFDSDQRVYVRVTAAGYIPLQTSEYSLIPGKGMTIQPVLRKAPGGSDVRILLEKTMDITNGKPITQLKSGEKYHQRYQIYLPEGKSTGGAGVHIREGMDGIMEEDPVFLTAIRGGDASILRGTSYQPASGWETDGSLLTQGNAKWIQLEWETLEGGDYWVETDWEVRPDVATQEEVSIQYRAWGITESGSVERDPFDSQLGGAANSPDKDGLYAETHTTSYFANIPLSCGSIICLGGEIIEEIETHAHLENAPILEAGNDYVYSFVLKSGSETTLENVQMSLALSGEEGAVSFTDYTISFSTNLVEGHGFSSFFIPTNGETIILGKMIPGEYVLGKIAFRAQKKGTSHLSLRVKNGNDLLLDHSLLLKVESTSSFILTASPTQLLPFTPDTVDLTLTDTTPARLEGVPLEIYQKGTDESTTLLGIWMTSSEGKTTLETPSLFPGEGYVITAQKEKYDTTTLYIPVTNQPVVSTPAQLEASIALVANAEKKIEFTLENKTTHPLVIHSASWSTDPSALFAWTSIYQSIAEWKGKSIPGGKTIPLSFGLKTKSTIKITQTQISKGTIHVLVENPLTSQVWVVAIPTTVTLTPLTGCQTGGIHWQGVGDELFLERGSSLEEDRF